MSIYFDLLMHRKFDEADEYRKSLVPQKLVKFISLTNDEESNEKKLTSLANNQIWFSHISLLNDPYEFNCMYINKDELKKHGYDDWIISQFNNIICNDMKAWVIASLSGNSFDCLPMWAYYTNNYEGFCIEYEVTNAELINPVSYEPKRIPIASIIANFYSEFRKMQEHGEETNPEVDFYATLLKQQLFLKHESWKSEKEYRIVCPIKSGKGINIDISIAGLRVNRICAGYRCSKEHKEKLNEICSTLKCHSLLETNISHTNYTLLENY